MSYFWDPCRARVFPDALMWPCISPLAWKISVAQGVLLETICVLCTLPFSSLPFISPCTPSRVLFCSLHLLGEGPLFLQSQWRSVCGETDRHTKTADRLQAAWVIFLKGNPDSIFPVFKTSFPVSKPCYGRMLGPPVQRLPFSLTSPGALVIYTCIFSKALDAILLSVCTEGLLSEIHLFLLSSRWTSSLPLGGT